MSRARRRGAVVSLLLAVVLALAAVVAAAGSASASTRTEPLRASFENLVPGSTAAAAWGLELRRDSVVTGVTLAETGPGDLDWAVELQDRTTGTRTPLTAGARGTQLTAGTYDLRVTVHVVDIPGGATSTLDGHVVFAESGTAGGGLDSGAGPGGGYLASTGFAALPLLLTAVATALVGLLLLLGARRRRDEEDEARAVPVTGSTPSTPDHRS
ncbi:hypothetical protein [Cellulomonas sp.]|uniref:hypothetical protein n=1 Tax=Cellulomonas sp. TaxID=40001 RepID=UPI001B17C804|nr:hypothetical protein [Cellulomonas sp.]MBO9556319.1 hypothetical protein [Cellulomonas sp.]